MCVSQIIKLQAIVHDKQMYFGSSNIVPSEYQSCQVNMTSSYAGSWQFFNLFREFSFYCGYWVKLEIHYDYYGFSNFNFERLYYPNKSHTS